MKGDLVYELIGGIREEFLLEAEPRGLAALTTADVPLYPLDEKPTARKRKRWRPWLVAAVLLVVVGINFGAYAGVTTLLEQSGHLPAGMPSLGGDLFGSLFPFLSPEADPPYEVTVRDPEDITEPEETETQPLPETETEPETETQPLCSDGHDYEESVEREATCYAVSVHRLVCCTCGEEMTRQGTEFLAHDYENGYCVVCGLIEGAHPSDCFTFAYTNSVGYTDQAGGNNVAEGYILYKILGNIGETLILPNVLYTEDHGLLPVIALKSNFLQGRSEFSKLVLPKGLLDIDNAGVFAQCTSLTEIVWPDSLRKIGHSAFEGCTSLKEVTIPSTVVEMGGWVFANCTSLKTAVLPDNLTDIGQSTFQGCSALRDVNLPAGLPEIPPCTFAYCTSLETVRLPEKLRVIDAEAFRGCTLMTSINIPDSVEGLRDAAFMECSALEVIRLPAKLSQLMTGAFSGCELITELSLPSKLKYLERGAFLGLNIREVSLPSSLIKVDKEAFAGCTTLESVTYAGTVQEWKELFAGSLSIPVYCTDGTIDPAV